MKKLFYILCFSLTVSFTACNKEHLGHRYVDLGLPSGTKWATCNVGSNLPEEYGDYFAWGETMTKETYNLDTYNLCDGSFNSQTKYCKLDNKIVLELIDDAANVNWGGNWRIPTKEELDELHTQCIWKWECINGINGYTITGPNDNSIFMPAAGFCIGSDSLAIGTDGGYWSSSLESNEYDNAHSLYFNLKDVYSNYTGLRFFGQSIRPVLSK